MVLGFFDFGKNASIVSETTKAIPFSIELVILVLILIAITIIIMFYLKKIIVNSVLGGVIWFVAVFVFNVQLGPTLFIPSFVISVIFGPAGIGTILLLLALGII
ncbi:MAG: hypothetical protein GX950_00475 [Candidatus Diapherotrites archaeon]|jgi:hypothetical protein|uniref:SigmaK-factor processing regulatory BofA n=1 Tax=Candidatus Iainarchaeum sp. TaxID=3101447 RepID=A0A7K4BYE2_9ARCH|nr:hypothetical protein [Candidatus Diapherotrites archaeon]